MLKRSTVASCVFVVLAAGLAWAGLPSAILNYYSEPVGNIINVQIEINKIRKSLELIDPSQLVKQASEIEALNKLMGGQIRVAKSSFEEFKGTKTLNLKVLNDIQASTLSGILDEVDPGLAYRIRQKEQLSDEEFIQALGDCTARLSGAGESLVAVLSFEQPDDQKIQIHRANILIEMGRFDMLVGYFTLLVENSDI